jgi:EpsD family peptidyl-prolyl cis-trans isomerase
MFAFFKTGVPLTSTRCLIGSLVVAALVGGCGSKSDAPKDTQVVAKVNSGEVSVHQLNFYLQGVGNVPADKLPAVKKQVLDRMIEQEALIQEAMLKKLDRDPIIQQQLEAAKRDVLVKAYFQKIATAIPMPDQPAIDKFFAENARLFEKRKIFRFAEITFPSRPINWPELEKALLPTKSIAEAAEVLKAKGIELPIGQNINRGTEDLPIDQVDKFLALKDGEVVIYSRPPGIIVAQILSSKDAPVDATKARPVIERYLANKARSEAVQAEMKRVKEGMKVTYMGEFAPGAVAAKPPTTGTPVPQNPTDEVKTLENGLKGLK